VSVTTPDLSREEHAEAQRQARVVEAAVVELAREVQEFMRWRKHKRLPDID
jgi:hypothetical protein